jgi:lipopolysaccharide/colanic/teichoic acid biosynthesis glycosyltransferase
MGPALSPAGGNAATCVSPGSSAIGRLFDFSAALLLLGLASPLLLLIAAAVRCQDGGPAFFRQERIGRGGRPFRLWKFRTMRAGRSGAVITRSGDHRITRVGAVLRAYKLDELPQLWNVLRGDMSLIGPRPEVPCFVDQGNPVWQAVHSVRPGITDLATLVFRDEERILAAFADPERGYRETVLPAKLALNLQYLERRSALRDLKLLVLTVRYSFLPAGFDPERVKRSILAENS